MGATPHILYQGLLPYPVSGHSQRACAPAWGVPPSPSLGWGPPPLPPQHAVREKRTLLGGCPSSTSWSGVPPPLSPASHAQGVHTALGGAPTSTSGSRGPPYSSPACREGGGNAAVLGGSPLTPPPRMCAGVAHCLVGVDPSLPACTRGVHAAAWGFPLLLLPLTARWGSAPRPLCGAPPGDFLHSGGLTSPLLPSHSVGLGVHSGGLTTPKVSPTPKGSAPSQTPLASFFRPLLVLCPMADPRPRLVVRRGGGFLAVNTAGLRIHP